MAAQYLGKVTGTKGANATVTCTVPTVPGAGLLIVVFSAYWSNSNNNAVFTIDGSSGTLDKYQQSQSGTTWIGHCEVLSGGTPAFWCQLDYNGSYNGTSSNSVELFFYFISDGGYVSATPDATGSKSDAATGSGSNRATVQTINTIDPSCVIYSFAGAMGSSAVTALSWSSMSENDVFSATDLYASVASSFTAGTETPHSETCTWSRTSTTYAQIACASWTLIASQTYTVEPSVQSWTITGLGFDVHRIYTATLNAASYLVSILANRIGRTIIWHLGQGHLVIKQSWHSPKPDLRIRRKVNKWWRKLIR